MSYETASNNGLPYNFALSEGKFVLSGGSQKAVNNLRMFLGFIGWFRIYYPDYVPNILRLIQKSSSQISATKTLILGTLEESIEKYLPQIQLLELGLGRGDTLRDWTLALKYKYRLKKEDTFIAAVFLTT